MSRIPVGVGVGLALAAVWVASPLGVTTVALAALVVTLAGQGLPAAERRQLAVVLLLAIGARLAIVALMFLAGAPKHDALNVGALAGDEAYYLSRALRARDLIAGFGATSYDYFVVTDEYGRTSYLSLMTFLQVVFGPTPYSLRVLNAVLFVAGAALLFRLARPAFGSVPALGALVVLLFLPSLLVASVSLLKESLYFLTANLVLVCAVAAVRAGWGRRLALLAVAAAGLWLLNDLRRGALVLSAGGLVLGLALWLATASRRRVMAAAAALLIGVSAALSVDEVRSRALSAVESAARMHAGHVFTVGHAYKLMDEGFYVNPEAPGEWEMRLSPPQAARFLIRAAASFLVTPLPWEMTSMRQMLFLPEHLAWYLLLGFLPFGVSAGGARDRLTTCALLGYALPMAVALAVTNGNVGTLLRLRGLVTPYLVWLSTLGVLAVGERLLERRQVAPHPAASALVTSEGPVT